MTSYKWTNIVIEINFLIFFLYRTITKSLDFKSMYYLL